MKTNLHIKKLDSGFVLTTNGKTEAIGTQDELVATVQAIFRNKLPQFQNINSHNFSITIETEVNPPQIAEKL